ncbi:hypothetical protein HMPREF3293_00427 [Christensenella minuta]|uniref:Uncharacterized protein n=1 Tax=Christensenella minuta TaxID=626937 RepID=A0A136Q832_9FIRM|nr:hypothetical protein HMPREF3293_00427 [Christensenella minuta]
MSRVRTLPVWKPLFTGCANDEFQGIKKTAPESVSARLFPCGFKL